MTEEPDLSEPYRRARALLVQMYIGKWKDDIPDELRHEIGLVLFGHEDEQLP